MEIVEATVANLKDENLYGEDSIATLFSLKPSEKFSTDVSVLFNEFCRKKNQDVLLQKFYALIYWNWKEYFPSCEDQKAINLLLIHFPERLVALCMQKPIVTERAAAIINIDMLYGLQPDISALRQISNIMLEDGDYPSCNFDKIMVEIVICMTLSNRPSPTMKWAP